MYMVYSVSKAMPRAVPKSELDFTSHPTVKLSLRNKRKFCKNKDFLSLSLFPFSLSLSLSLSFFYWNIQPPDFYRDINSAREVQWTNLQPPNNQSDSSSGQCLSGTCSSLGRSRELHVYVAATFCARCAWRRFCDSSLSRDWLSSGWFACPPAAMPPETESRYAASIVWNPSITLAFCFPDRRPVSCDTAKTRVIRYATGQLKLSDAENLFQKIDLRFIIIAQFRFPPSPPSPPFCALQIGTRN